MRIEDIRVGRKYVEKYGGVVWKDKYNNTWVTTGIRDELLRHFVDTRQVEIIASLKPI